MTVPEDFALMVKGEPIVLPLRNYPLYVSRATKGCCGGACGRGWDARCRGCLSSSGWMYPNGYRCLWLCVGAYRWSSKWISAIAWELGFTSGAKRGATIDLCLVRRRDVSSLVPRDHLAFQALLERKIDLVLNEQGSAVILQGDAGVGKTHLLHKFVNDLMPKKSSMMCATASPFKRDVSFATWAEVLIPALDALIPSTRQPNRTGVVMHVRASVSAVIPPHPGLAHYVLCCAVLCCAVCVCACVCVCVCVCCATVALLCARGFT